MCVRERETDRQTEREGDRDREKGRKREGVEIELGKEEHANKEEK